MGQEIAYVKGVLDGDGWIDQWSRNSRLCLEVKDEWFAKEFFDALKRLGLSPYTSERDRVRSFNGYTFSSHMIRVRATVDRELVKRIGVFEPVTDEEKRAYVRGFFDSEGCFKVYTGFRLRNGRYYERTDYNLKISNQNLLLLTKIQTILSEFGVDMTIRNYSHDTCAHLQTQDQKNIQRFFNFIEEVVN